MTHNHSPRVVYYYLMTSTTTKKPRAARRRRKTTPKPMTEQSYPVTKEEEKVFANLAFEPVQIDELCNQLKMDTPEVLSILRTLELKNIVEQHPRKLFSKIR